MIALTTTEVEYMAITNVVKEIIWLRRLCGELSVYQGVTIVHCNSRNAIRLTKDWMYHENNAH